MTFTEINNLAEEVYVEKFPNGSLGTHVHLTPGPSRVKVRMMTEADFRRLRELVLQLTGEQNER